MEYYFDDFREFREYKLISSSEKPIQVTIKNNNWYITYKNRTVELSNEDKIKMSTLHNTELLKFLESLHRKKSRQINPKDTCTFWEQLIEDSVEYLSEINSKVNN